ncbi:MAG TPA: VOC family protein [Anaerolineales bacterium]|nr:VOC family protein [Anaerolineales bacterium]
MGLKLFMLGLTVRDMPRALEFYRRLGLDVPEGSETSTHVEIPMGRGFTFFLDSNPGRWDPGFDVSDQPDLPESPQWYPMVLEFYVRNQSALEAKYAELIDFGYESCREPYRTSFGMYFAMVKDPDGNTILISAKAKDNSETEV